MRILALTGVVIGWACLTFAYAIWVVRRPGRLPTATNYRGKQLPVCLGVALGLLVFWPDFFRADWFIDSTLQTSESARAAISVSIVLVFFAGWYDDVRAGPARGLRRHFIELARGQITPGVVKLFVIVGAATLVSFSLADGLVRVLLGIPVIAGSANLWNLLDVGPGRALKWFLVVALVMVGWYARYDELLLAAALGSAAAVLVFDLRERAMLGDAGSNLLGFIIGLALFRVLPTWGLGIALSGILILHALGETITLSRIIEATPPLRWFDRLGRLPAHQAKPDTGPTPRDPAAT